MDMNTIIRPSNV